MPQAIQNVRIGDVMKEQGFITDDQLNNALAYQKEHKGERIGSILIKLGYISEHQMLDALGKRLGLSVIRISDLQVKTEAVAKIPQQLAEKYLMLAVSEDGGNLNVVLNDPLDFYGIEDVRQLTGENLIIMLSEKAPLKQAIDYYYSDISARRAAKTANESTGIGTVDEMVIDTGAGDDDTPIINLVNNLLQKAYSENASDVHIEPFEKNTMVRMRIDGTLVDYVTLQRNIHASLIARIKIMSELDIAERRVPQDGHFRIKMGDQIINIRTSVIPTTFGEKAVMRLLANNSQIEHSGEFGMNHESYLKFEKMMKSPNGIIYLTGPTGSGKSTTLYMALEELSHRPVNISTIEDPVEKNVPRLNQMQVNNLAGLTFETGLRALLRQDPDIIMVGETRDAETASISVRAAITGHLVLSTLHTNDAASSVVRLTDMGIEPYMIANSLVGIVAQRLMRKVCPFCSKEDRMTADEIEYVGKELPSVKRAIGCSHCNGTGYSGRIAIHEILTIDKKLREMISDGATVEEMKEYAVAEQGMKTLKTAGLELVEQGITTMDELRKVAYYE
ncbi:MAG: GspE/PulE family protein [Lachnospiraceae bacterium]|jgi:type IV pilus assembly protein PilB|nr:GspE/PulE family protein [Lachnospiraceae bacterium]MCI1726773.1 GspE/PulE family protein [Lachnospiraceae bacterium]